MRSFRFYFFAVPPECSTTKRRADYTAAELAQFRVEFEQNWSRRKLLAIPSYVALGCWVCGMLAGLVLQPAFFVDILLYLGLLLLAIITYIAVALRFPRCPACNSEIDEFIKEYCPYCGQAGLRPPRFIRNPACDSCGTALGVGKGRTYPVRYCTSCGIPVRTE